MRPKPHAPRQSPPIFVAYAQQLQFAHFGRPELVEVPPGGQQVFEAQALRHPCAYMSRATSCFVPNDVRMGGGEPPFILLTGAPAGYEKPTCYSFGRACGCQMAAGGECTCSSDSVKHRRCMSVEQGPKSWLMGGPGVQGPIWAASQLCCGRRASLRCWRRCNQIASCSAHSHHCHAAVCSSWAVTAVLQY